MVKKAFRSYADIKKDFKKIKIDIKRLSRICWYKKPLKDFTEKIHRAEILMNITLKGSEYNKPALIFCINNLGYLNAGCSFLRKLCRALCGGRLFLIWPKEDLGRQNRMGSRWEAGGGRAGGVSLMGNKGMKRHLYHVGKQWEFPGRFSLLPAQGDI